MGILFFTHAQEEAAASLQLPTDKQEEHHYVNNEVRMNVTNEH